MPEDPRKHQKLGGFLSMNNATHIGEFVPDDAKHPGQPFFVKCSCGSEGRSPREDMARWWMGEHLGRRGGQWKPEPALETTEEKESPSGSEPAASEGLENDARVQGGGAALGVEAGPESEKPQAGDSDSAQPGEESVVEEAKAQGK
jgi:hypothetical protein